MDTEVNSGTLTYLYDLLLNLLLNLCYNLLDACGVDAAIGHTAAEILYDRADNSKPFMGMTSFKGDWPTLQDAKVAKNYLSTEELKILNNLVSGYFDFAEIQAIRHQPMYMTDYIQQLDTILSSTGQELLTDAGRVSHNDAITKVTEEYNQWRNHNLSPVEQAYFETIKKLGKKSNKKRNP